MIDKPTVEGQIGRKEDRLISGDEKGEILGLGVNGEAFLTLMRDEFGFLEMRSIVPDRSQSRRILRCPLLRVPCNQHLSRL